MYILCLLQLLSSQLEISLADYILHHIASLYPLSRYTVVGRVSSDSNESVIQSFLCALKAAWWSVEVSDDNRFGL